MAKALTFLGEIAIIGETAPDKDLGNFQTLPNVDIVQTLAAEFRDHLELMPYQEAGAQMKLAVSVYLVPREGNGRVIAVLARDEYPRDLEGLQAAVAVAHRRLLMIRKVSGKYVDSSLQSALDALEQLSRRLREPSGK